MAGAEMSLTTRLTEIADNTPGRIGVAATSLETGETAAVRGDEHFPMQSVYKLPIAMAILAKVDRGELALTQMVHVAKEDLIPTTMFSALRDAHPEAEIDVSLADLLAKTIIESDGTTSDVLMRVAGGAKAIEDYLRGLGIEGIAIATTEKTMGLDAKAQYRNWGTPSAYIQLLRILAEGRALSDASQSYLLDLMTKSTTGPKRIRGVLPAEAKIAHKTGSSGTHDGMTAATNDVGIVSMPNGQRFAIAVFVSDSPADETTREGTIAQLARVVWDHWQNAVPEAETQREQDEYTQYELLAPETASFKITYEVTATTVGAKLFWNPIRKGSTASDEAVFDVMTGGPLKFVQVSGTQAKAHGLSEADAASDYIEVELARPVPPEGGQARLRIVKTYKDEKSYRGEGDTIVFDRLLGIRRNAIVLPPGFRLTECNVPSQILSEADGRIRVAFMHQAPGQAALILKARPGARTDETAKAAVLAEARSWEPPPKEGPTEKERLTERAHQDRDIVYFLQQPETHAFKLYHDYTESREGIDKYLNVVRPGSKVSDPSGRILDTGEPLKVEVTTGADLKDTGEEKIGPEQQVVIFRFPAIKKGESRRLRMSETYTAPQGYGVQGSDLVFDRSFGRARNAVVLPPGWYLTWLSIPGVISQTADGLTRIDWMNGRPDNISVLLKARKVAEKKG